VHTLTPPRPFPSTITTNARSSRVETGASRGRGIGFAPLPFLHPNRVLRMHAYTAGSHAHVLWGRWSILPVLGLVRV
jgi:hypothetical protein